MTIADEVPWSEELTAYDREHLTVYLRLLDAKAEGTSPREMARVILEIDPDRDPQRADRAAASHLRRAEWMSARGYRELLEGDK